VSGEISQRSTALALRAQRHVAPATFERAPEGRGFLSLTLPEFVARPSGRHFAQFQGAAGASLLGRNRRVNKLFWTPSGSAGCLPKGGDHAECRSGKQSYTARQSKGAALSLARDMACRHWLHALRAAVHGRGLAGGPRLAGSAATAAGASRSDEGRTSAFGGSASSRAAIAAELSLGRAM
jgi:hypothetical protein